MIRKHGAKSGNKSNIRMAKNSEGIINFALPPFDIAKDSKGLQRCLPSPSDTPETNKQLNSKSTNSI
jgi:hypothetical protein